MAKVAVILGSTGEGKTSSTVINPDGHCIFLDEEPNPKDYLGMNPKSHLIINLDGKELPIPPKLFSVEKGNVINIANTNFESIIQTLNWAAKNPSIKSVALDTINVYLARVEYNERRKMTYDQWKNVANDIIAINDMCLKILRDDQIAYIMGHTMDVDQNDNTSKKMMSVIGKKLTKLPPESFYTTVLTTEVVWGEDGDNEYYFQTRGNHSTAKSPMGMFKDYRIPNSLKLVDDLVRKFYNMK